MPPARTAALVLAGAMSLVGCSAPDPEGGIAAPRERHVEQSTFERAKTSLARGDHPQALRLYRAAAEDGSVEAQYTLGVLLALGVGGPADVGEAETWYRRAAASSGAAAQYNLGEKYGNGVPPRPADERDRDRWIAKLSRLGEPTNPLKTGSDYHFGERGLDEDPAEAFAWYSRAASADHVMAWRRLAEMRLAGRGTERDLSRAWMWFTLCAEQGVGNADIWLTAIVPEMSPEARSEGERLLAEWKTRERRGSRF